MENNYLPLDERPEKKIVLIFMIVFGALCMFTTSWWAIYLIKAPENSNIFWLGTIFLFLFGAYQIYAGLGYAKRYLKIVDDVLIVKPNSFFAPVSYSATQINKILISSSFIEFDSENRKKFKLKLGIRYPEQGDKIKEAVADFAENFNIGIEFLRN